MIDFNNLANFGKVFTCLNKIYSCSKKGLKCTVMRYKKHWAASSKVNVQKM